ncbi:MAG: SEC59/DGK1/VTE5 family protein [bacterium]|jgi:dolichol kinase
MDGTDITYTSEVRRKLVHLVALLIPVLYYLWPSAAQAKALLLGGMIIAVGVDTFRLGEPRYRRLLHSLSGELIRPGEKENLLGSTCLLIASTITVFLFPKQVAVAALCFLIIGDTVAALVGRRFGRIRLFGRKTLAGSLAFFVVAFAAGSVIPGLDTYTALIGAAVAAVAEALPLPVDDNFSIPILSGVAMVLVRALSG